jgi:hypothetical protein
MLFYWLPIITFVGTLPFQPVIVLVKNHLERYPEMQIQDVYKMLYQGEFGVGHLIDNPDIAKNYLNSELEQITSDSTEPLWEYISPDTDMVRINLRPFKAQQLNSDKLIQAMWKTARMVVGDTTQLYKNWKIIIEGIERGLLPLSANDAISFWQQMQIHGFPAVHHSEVYQQAYHPAYRVIKSEYLEEVIH